MAGCFPPIVSDWERVIVPIEKFGNNLYELWDWAGNCGIEKVVMLWERKPDPYHVETKKGDQLC